jgi:uncharacterized protein YndB with AHSA1/START domain
MAAENKITPDTSDREIVITRLINAPRELVFQAWTDPQHIGEWWGPNGFTNTILEMDVRSGGTWRFIMHGPDGTDYRNRIVYTEVKKPSLLAYDHDDDSENAIAAFNVVVTFEKEGSKTRLTLRTIFPTKEARDFAIKEIHAIEGGNQTISRFEEYLARFSN